MITRKEFEDATRRAAQMVRETGIVVREEELKNFTLLDFGLGELKQTGVELLWLVNAPTLTLKILVLFPHQTCPQHRHLPFEGSPGKEETFRCI
ncbi:MAG: cupin domain-containing protein, partial [Planctomycetota bacterium]